MGNQLQGELVANGELLEDRVLVVVRGQISFAVFSRHLFRELARQQLLGGGCIEGFPLRVAA